MSQTHSKPQTNSIFSERQVVKELVAAYGEMGAIDYCTMMNWTSRLEIIKYDQSR
jgi:hypothetical protein